MLESPLIAVCEVQAIRLVKNSIIAIESPEAEVDDVDFVDDLEEVEDVVDRFRRSEQQAAQPSAGAQGASPPDFGGSCQLQDICPLQAPLGMTAWGASSWWSSTTPWCPIILLPL